MAKNIDIEKLLKDGQAVQIKTTGTSMFPMLVSGRDQVIIEPVKEKDIHRGQVLLYRRLVEPGVNESDLNEKKAQALKMPENTTTEAENTTGETENATAETENTTAQSTAPGKLVLHRVWKVKGNEIYFVGDNQVKVEGPLNIFQVRGVMTAFIRKGETYSRRNRLYKCYAGIWLILRPFRGVIAKIYRIFVKN